MQNNTQARVPAGPQTSTDTASTTLHTAPPSVPRPSTNPTRAPLRWINGRYQELSQGQKNGLKTRHLGVLPLQEDVQQTRQNSGLVSLGQDPCDFSIGFPSHCCRTTAFAPSCEDLSNGALAPHFPVNQPMRLIDFLFEDQPTPKNRQC